MDETLDNYVGVDPNASENRDVMLDGLTLATHLDHKLSSLMVDTTHDSYEGGFVAGDDLSSGTGRPGPSWSMPGFGLKLGLGIGCSLVTLAIIAVVVFVVVNK